MKQSERPFDYHQGQDMEGCQDPRSWSCTLRSFLLFFHLRYIMCMSSGVLKNIFNCNKLFEYVNVQQYKPLPDWWQFGLFPQRILSSYKHRPVLFWYVCCFLHDYHHFNHCSCTIYINMWKGKLCLPVLFQKHISHSTY